MECKCVLTYNSKQGTGTLSRHKCAKQQNTPALQQTKISAFSKKIVSKSALDRLERKQLALVALDLHPLSVTEGRGFREYAQELINVGAEFGTQSFLDLVVSRKCLSTRVMIEEYDKLKKQIMADVADQNVAFTTDMWTDEHTQRSFISST
ncbi:hypothetical protein ACLKA7_008721 [Drosophila subpalustris]